jgi:phage-related protein
MKDFLGFRFGNIHTEDLHLKVVSSSNRYDRNLLPDPTDYTVDVPGGNGKYYFGQTYGTREFTVNVAFDNMDEITLRRISQIFSTDKP